MWKYGQFIPQSILKKLLRVAKGEIQAELVIQNVTFLDLIHGTEVQTHIAIDQGYIAGVGNDYSVLNYYDAMGLTIVPGFIDAHVHIESSLMDPFEFESLTLPLGTTTAICDPHEITNVMGEEGLSWFLRCATLMQQNLFVQVPSCIPSLPGFETVKKVFTADEMKKYRKHPHVLGLAEMMNYPGVISGDPETLKKIRTFQDMVLDGHSPITGKALNAYRLAGIQNCHESVTLESGREKLSLGMSLILREGSVAKNLNTLAPVVNEFNSSQCMLCSDDRHSLDMVSHGYINRMVRDLIQNHSVPTHVAYRLSSYSAAKAFQLKRFGLIAPGYKADFILLNNPKTVDIHAVYLNVKNIKNVKNKETRKQRLAQSHPPLKNTMQRNLLVEWEGHKPLVH